MNIQLPVQHGWFSKSVAAKHGSFIYLTPEGTEVCVTHVMSQHERQRHTLSDLVYVGEITRVLVPRTPRSHVPWP